MFFFLVWQTFCIDQLYIWGFTAPKNESSSISGDDNIFVFVFKNRNVAVNLSSIHIYTFFASRVQSNARLKCRTEVTWNWIPVCFSFSVFPHTLVQWQMNYGGRCQLALHRVMMMLADLHSVHQHRIYLYIILIYSQSIRTLFVLQQ